MVLFCKTLSSFHLRMPSLVKIEQMVLQKKTFYISSMCFCSFVIISPLQKAGPFIWMTLDPLHPRMPCAKFVWNWPIGSWEEDFQIWLMYFHYYIIISPWKRTGPSFEQLWIPFTQGCLVQSLIEISPRVLEKMIFKLSKCIFRYLVIISPWKRAGPFIWINLNHHHSGMLCAKFGWNWPCGSWEEDF